MSAAEHAKTLSLGALYCRSHTHGPWDPYTVDDSEQGRIVVVEVCRNCSSQARSVLDAVGRYVYPRRMTRYAPGYLQPPGSGMSTSLDRGSYRIAYLTRLRESGNVTTASA